MKDQHGFGGDGDFLFTVLLANATKNPERYKENKHKATLKRWGEEAAQLVTSGPKEPQGDEFQVSFRLIHPRRGAEKRNDPEKCLDFHPQEIT